jgi:hypothetical protein
MDYHYGMPYHACVGCLNLVCCVFPCRKQTVHAYASAKRRQDQCYFPYDKLDNGACKHHTLCTKIPKAGRVQSHLVMSFTYSGSQNPTG